MKFKNQYKRERVYSNSGEPYIYNYGWTVDDNGKKELVPTDKVDVYAQIQASTDSVDVHKILDMYRETGDLSLLTRGHPVFLDATDAPKTLAEMYQRVFDAENYFNGLPVDVRSQFNNSLGEFLASIGTDKFAEVFGIKKGDAASESESVEVKSDELS